MSFRNRCVVAGGAGPVNLSVPLLGGRNQRKPMKEVRIDNKSDWQGQHWKTITSCYNRSPWFEFYKHELEEIYNQPVDLLVDWNMRCWNWVMEKLDVGVMTEYTDGPAPGGASVVVHGTGMESNLESGSSRVKPDQQTNERQDRNVKARAQKQADSSQEFLDWRNKLMPKSIAKDFREAVRYRQVFEDRIGFLPHLSILDLLFCEGKRAVEILKSSKIPV